MEIALTLIRKLPQGRSDHVHSLEQAGCVGVHVARGGRSPGDTHLLHHLRRAFSRQGRFHRRRVRDHKCYGAVTHVGVWDAGGDGLDEAPRFPPVRRGSGDEHSRRHHRRRAGTLSDGFRFLDTPDVLVAAGTDLVLLVDNKNDAATGSPGGSNTDFMSLKSSAFTIDGAFSFRRSGSVLLAPPWLT